MEVTTLFVTLEISTQFDKLIQLKLYSMISIGYFQELSFDIFAHSTDHFY